MTRDRLAHFETMNRKERTDAGLANGTNALYRLHDNAFTCLYCLDRNEVCQFALFRDVEVRD